jgi:hypothetical protein
MALCEPLERETDDTEKWGKVLVQLVACLPHSHLGVAGFLYYSIYLQPS